VNHLVVNFECIGGNTALATNGADKRTLASVPALVMLQFFDLPEYFWTESAFEFVSSFQVESVIFELLEQSAARSTGVSLFDLAIVSQVDV
jgi:hypothetical protein